MHSYKYRRTADCEPWKGPMSPVLSLSHFQTKTIEDVYINYEKQLVKIKRKVAARVDEQGKLTTEGQADEIKQKVEEYMQEWKEKRGIYDDDL